MRCPNCSNEINENGTGKFCGYCGHRFEAVAPTTQSIAAPSQTGFSAATAAASARSATTPPPQSAGWETPPVSGRAERQGRQDSYAGGAFASANSEAIPHQGLFIEAFRHTIRWRPLSLVVVGVLAAAGAWILCTVVSGFIAAAISKSSLSGGAGSVESLLAFGMVSAAATVLIVYVIAMAFLGATAKMCYELTVLGNQWTRLRSLRFALSNIGAVTVTPFIVFIGVGAVLLGEWILFLMGQIDFVGPILTGFMFAPLTILNVCLILTAYYGVWLSFMSLASGATGIGNAVKKTWSLVRSSYRSMVPELLALTLVQAVVGLIGGGLLLVGFQMTTSIAWFGGGVVSRMVSGAGIERLMNEMFQSASRGGYSSSFGAAESGYFFGFIAFGIGMALLIGFAHAFNIVFFLNGCSRVYDRNEKTAGSREAAKVAKYAWPESTRLA